MKMNDWPDWANPSNATANGVNDFFENMKKTLLGFGVDEGTCEWYAEWTFRTIMREAEQERLSQDRPEDLERLRAILDAYEHMEEEPLGWRDWRATARSFKRLLPAPKRRGRPATAKPIQTDVATSLAAMLNRPPTPGEFLAVLRVIFGPNYSTDVSRTLAEIRKAQQK